MYSARSNISSCVRRWFGMTFGTERSHRTTPSKVGAGRFAIASKVGTPERPVRSPWRAATWQLAQWVCTSSLPRVASWARAGWDDKATAPAMANVSFRTSKLRPLLQAFLFSSHRLWQGPTDEGRVRCNRAIVNWATPVCMVVGH